jgi:hypothetical protein
LGRREARRLNYDSYYNKLTHLGGIRLMGEKGLVEEDWNDRQNWRKKIT